jgi:anti-sigma regulatory factor (Ser/Thr protein kinase)
MDTAGTGVGSMFYTVNLPKSSSAAAQARRAVERLHGKVRRDTLADARLLVSELVTNAVEHVSADGEIELRVDVRDHVLRVEVLDQGPGFTPRPRREDDRKDGGWGLHFLARLADRWAVDVDGRARVWFELALN